MKTLKYTVIKSRTQYREYCSALQKLAEGSVQGKVVQDEIDLLTLLIERWDADHNSFEEIDPVSLLRSFLVDHGIRAADLARRLNISKGYVSDILSYKKGMSKYVIRELASCFKVSQEAFNRPYALRMPSHVKKARKPVSAR